MQVSHWQSHRVLECCNGLIPEYDSNFLDTVGKKLADLEANVAYLSNFFITDTERPINPSTSGGLSHLPKHGKNSISLLLTDRCYLCSFHVFTAFLQQIFDAKTLEKVTSTGKVCKCILQGNFFEDIKFCQKISYNKTFHG